MSKARPHREVTDAELAILEVLWRSSELTIRDLTDRLYPQGGTSAYATVQKLLERLEKKGCVARRRETSAHRFSASVEREQLIDHSLREVAEKLCGGSMTPLLTQLVRARGLSPAERDELQALIDRFDRKTP
ncbi:MAG: BlaI/MecI/CopY family transcriptional regulator [Planctomycetes bacterium]|nr:BlaI/MecI/CopY family transcriptional regulator [Planctomycetota bacterium]